MIAKRAFKLLFARPFEKISINKLQNNSIVSFDVFDTLIMRKTKKPCEVFTQINDDEFFKRKRILAEKKARRVSEKEEVTLEEIYKYLPEYNLDEEIAKEIDNCYANPKALQLYNRIKKMGKKIIIISDMYLSCDNISMILQKAGYDIKNVPIYVSSEYGKTKRTGRLFKIVLKEYRGQKIVHIGDNVISDYLRPRFMGIETILCSEK